MAIELLAPVKVVGDIQGHFKDLINIFDHNGYPSENNYLFLGDYVDRGKYSIETICLLFAYKLKNPGNVFLLRGNHECMSVNRVYGFYDECTHNFNLGKRKYDIKIWKMFCDVFNYLSVAAIIEKKIFCVHGGLSPGFEEWEKILEYKKPI